MSRATAEMILRIILEEDDLQVMNKSTLVIGSILILFGLFFLLKSLDLIWFGFGDLLSVLFPLALIAVGIWLIGRRKNSGRTQSGVYYSTTFSTGVSSKSEKTDYDPSKVAQNQAQAGPIPPPPHRQAAVEEMKEAPSTQTGGKIRFNKMLGDMFIDCEGFNLTNVDVSAGIGDVEIKILGGQLSKGLNRIVISGFIGDIRVFVPRDVNFFAHCSNFVGDIEVCGKRASGFGNTVEHQSPNYDKAESKLYIASNSFIGDMKVYQV